MAAISADNPPTKAEIPARSLSRRKLSRTFESSDGLATVSEIAALAAGDAVDRASEGVTNGAALRQTSLFP